MKYIVSPVTFTDVMEQPQPGKPPRLVWSWDDEQNKALTLDEAMNGAILVARLLNLTTKGEQ